MKEEDYNNWKTELLKKHPIDSSIIEQLDIFKNSELPFIIDFTHLSLLLGINKKTLSTIIYSPEKYYRSFKISKRNGSEREISSPYPVLRYIQRWILRNILENILVNENATGFIKNKSILDNIKPHLNQECVLKIDLKDFFPNIKFTRIMAIFKVCGYTNKVSFYLARLCSCNGSLPQGASTSPYLANIVAKKLDSRLYCFAKYFSLAYTRYADDIAFSGETLPWKLQSYIYKIIEEEGFIINENKTKLLKGNSKKIITGISVNTISPKVPRSYKRQLRHESFIMLKLTKEQYISTIFCEDPVKVERLIGKFYYWKYIENDNLFVTETLKKLITFSDSL